MLCLPDARGTARAHEAVRNVVTVEYNLTVFDLKLILKFLL